MPAKRYRHEIVEELRYRHSTKTQLRRLVYLVENHFDETGREAVVSVLRELVEQLEAKSFKANRNAQIVRACDQLLPKLAKVKALTRKGLPVVRIDMSTGLSSWIRQNNVNITAAQIVKLMSRPKVHDGQLVAYEVVSKIRRLLITKHQVKTIYNAARRSRR